MLLPPEPVVLFAVVVLVVVEELAAELAAAIVVCPAGIIATEEKLPPCVVAVVAGGVAERMADEEGSIEEEEEGLCVLRALEEGLKVKSAAPGVVEVHEEGVGLLITGFVLPPAPLFGSPFGIPTDIDGDLMVMFGIMSSRFDTMRGSMQLRSGGDGILCSCGGIGIFMSGGVLD